MTTPLGPTPDPVLHAQETLDVRYAHLGWLATVTPLAGEPFEVRILPDAEPEEIGGFGGSTRRRDTILLRARVSEWPQPVKGDRITLTGTDAYPVPAALQASRKVSDATWKDAYRLEWYLETEGVE